MNRDVISAADRRFGEEVRAFIHEAFDADLREQAARQAGTFAEHELAMRWRGALHRRGWAAPSWPEEFGGPGWSDRQRQIFAFECARVGTPALPDMGILLCGPVIMRFGTPAQQAFFLPRMLSGEHVWCQGYSEPGAGSDLASLATRAVADGDDYVVNGSKIWTTNAHNANWIFLLARTAETEKPQRGISFLVSPMTAPGLTVRPIRSISGEHELNQLFFDNVRIPITNRMGAENEGWSVAKYLLEFERGGGALGAALRSGMARLRAMAAAEFSGDGETLAEDAAFRARAASLEIDLIAADLTDLRLGAGHNAGETVGAAAASIKKLLASHRGQDIAELAAAVLGAYAAGDQRAALGARPNADPIGPEHGRTVMARYLNGRASTIYGGSSEIQHNILARLIGL